MAFFLPALYLAGAAVASFFLKGDSDNGTSESELDAMGRSCGDTVNLFNESAKRKSEREVVADFKKLSESAQKGFCSRPTIFHNDFISMLKRNGAEKEASLCIEHQEFAGPAGKVDAFVKEGYPKIKIVVDSDGGKKRALEYIQYAEDAYKGIKFQLVDDREQQAWLKGDRSVLGPFKDMAPGVDALLSQNKNTLMILERLTVPEIYFDECYLPDGAATRNSVLEFGP